MSRARELAETRLTSQKFVGRNTQNGRSRLQRPADTIC